jgi:hypothetical protein
VREKQLKNWSRAKKIALINRANPDWRDLSGEIHDDGEVRGKRSLGSASLKRGGYPARLGTTGCLRPVDNASAQGLIMGFGRRLEA